MRTLLLFICTLLTGFAQGIPEEMLLMRPAPAAGATESGPPEVYAAVTNVITSAANTLSVTCDFSTKQNRLAFVFVSWYPSSSTISAITCGGDSMSLLTNSFYYTTTAPMELYGKIAPASGSQIVSVTWSGNVSEASLIALAITNAAQTSTFNVPTNLASQTSFDRITNYIQTASGELQLMHVVLGNSPRLPTALGSGQVVTTNCPVGSELHSATVTKKNGTTTSTAYHTNWVQWGEVNNLGALGISVRGLP